MAFRVNKAVPWQAGAGSPIKYIFYLDVNLSIESISGMTATIRMVGTYGVQNSPTNSRNSFAASDFALVTKGGVDPWNYPFTLGTYYYQSPLPFSPNAPQSVIDGILIEFRGDTWRADPVNSNNRSTLYARPSGIVLDAYDGDVYQSFNINTTFTVDISGGGNVPLLTWVSSGCGSSVDYTWMEHQVWASWFDLDYRPGATLDTNTNVWKSHNRTNGACHILPNTSGTNWHECRTLGGDASAQGNPPLILHAANANSWYNQKRIGKP